MKLENQVCSLELAKKLKELKVKQESLWWWVNEYMPVQGYGDRWKIACYRPQTKGIRIYSNSCDYQFCDIIAYSAFTVAELGEELPSSIVAKGDKEYCFKIYKYGKNWNLTYEWDDGFDGGNILKYINDESLANAMSKMLIWLIEQGKHSV